MRVPFPVVILLCSCVIGGVWWSGTRKQDFLSPPSEDRLALIREKTVDAFPSTDVPPDVDATAETATTLEPIPVSPDRQAGKQAPPLAEQPYQVVNEPAMVIVLRAGTGKSNAVKLAPVLKEISRDLEQATSGILKISSSVKAGNDIPESIGDAPVALWLSGPGAGAPSTEVLVSPSSPDELLRDQILKNLLQLIRSYLARTASISVPPAGDVDEDPLEAIQSRITRLGWLELGSRLNKTLE